MSHDHSNTTKLAILISRVFPLPFVIIGAVMLYTGGKEIYLARESMTWPSVDGTILNSTVDYDPDHGESPSYKTGILYSFMVNEHTRMGRKVTFGDTSPNYCAVQTVVNRYPTGAVVKVHYRANDPDTCILEPGLEHGHFWARPGFGLLLFVPFSLLAVFWPRWIRQNEELRLRSALVPTLSDESVTPKTRGGRISVSKIELAETIKQHELWRRSDGKEGRQADLCRANLTGANLRGACLVDADMEGVTLQKADLCRADLTEAYLKNADLTGANLSESNLANAQLCGVNLDNANLRGACLHRADIDGASLQKADLCGADLTGAYLRNKTDLTGANLARAKMKGVNLARAKLKGANLTGVELSLFNRIVATVKGAIR